MFNSYVSYVKLPEGSMEMQVYSETCGLQSKWQKHELKLEAYRIRFDNLPSKF